MLSEQLDLPSSRRDNRGRKLFVARSLALRRKGYDPRRSGEIMHLFCVSEFNSVAGVTVLSCHVFFCATTVVCKCSQSLPGAFH